MADSTTFMLNGSDTAVISSPDTPLLYVLIDELQLQGPRFGCGLAQCGSCSVLVDGVELRSCVTPLSAVIGKRVTTLEGKFKLSQNRSLADRVGVRQQLAQSSRERERQLATLMHNSEPTAE